MRRVPIAATILACAVACGGNDPASPTATPTPTIPASKGIVIDHTTTNTARIPTDHIATARNTLRIAYGHTSHGSQLVTGIKPGSFSVPSG